MLQKDKAAYVRQERIVVIEDERRSQRLIRWTLESAGFRVMTVDRVLDTNEQVLKNSPDLVVLDIKLPYRDGYAVCHDIRAVSRVPIVVVSALCQAHDKVLAFEAGADDYLTKPYEPAELVARIDAVLRRAQGWESREKELFGTGPLEINYGERVVRLAGKEIILTKTEYRLLIVLAQNSGRIVVADALLSTVWGPTFVGGYDLLYIYVSRLRKKLTEDAKNPRLILTCPGVGYMMPATNEIILSFTQVDTVITG